MTVFRVLFAAISALGVTMMSHDVAVATSSEAVRDVSVVERMPDDHPIGARVSITPLSIERTRNLNDATLATFLVDYPPGASAVLHRMPSSGYVLVHVLSGTIRASAWHADVGVYHKGETWVEPAIAYNITISNSSATQSAQALVILFARDSDNAAGPPQPVE
jgi:quercetin dioxygenase-like cupin family protein